MSPKATPDEFDVHMIWPSGTDLPGGRRGRTSRPAPPVKPTPQPVARSNPGTNGATLGDPAGADLTWMFRSLERVMGRLEAMVERLEVIQTATTSHLADLDKRLNEQLDGMTRLGRHVSRLGGHDQPLEADALAAVRAELTAIKHRLPVRNGNGNGNGK